MKTKVLLSTLLLFHLHACTQTLKRALFLGNSYTYYNDMPQLISDMATSMNDTLEYDSNTPGGWYLYQHSMDPVSLGKITDGNWDYLVMQDNSLAYAYGISPYSIAAIKSMDSLLRVYSPCAQSMLYITWGRKNGDTYSCSPPQCDSLMFIERTYFQMDSTIESNYMIIADSLHTATTPVGAVRRYIRTNFPEIELYLEDESHPTAAGTYAAACAFYATIFKRDPADITFDFVLSATDAAHIRTAASEVAYQHLEDWHVSTGFTYFSVPGNTVVFNNTSSTADSFTWDFGDGAVSPGTDAVHTYETMGIYPVTLIADHCSYQDTIMHVVYTNSATSVNEDLPVGITAYPNPADNELTLSANGISHLQIVNSLGTIQQCDYKVKGQTTIVEVSGLAAGLYYLSFTSNNHTEVIRLMKL